MPIELLFLTFQVRRDRTVRRRPSFHFMAQPRSAKLCDEFVVELLDAEREVLICMPVSCDCEMTGHHCWPKRFRGAIPYPQGARWLLIYEGERKLHEEWIPRPPRVTAEIERVRETVILKWRAEHETGDASDGCCEFWYLPQWFDAEDEVWRGLAPRTRATEMPLPLEFLRGREELELRVLASCGIATGIGTVGLRGPGREQPSVHLVTQRDGDVLGPQLTVALIGPGGRHLSLKSAGWTVAGREAGHGTHLDLRSLSQGSSDVRAFVRTSSGETHARSWQVRRDGGRFTLEHDEPGQTDQSPPDPSQH